jgi:hypothetical protein
MTMPSAVACVHFWILPPPDGPTCVGVCKHCGATKLHKNTGAYRDDRPRANTVEAVGAWPLSRGERRVREGDDG